MNDPSMPHPLGDNKPPPDVSISRAEVAYKRLADWLANNPVIQTEEGAKTAKVQYDLAKDALDEMETERDGRVRPLNIQVQQINGSYRGPRDQLTRLAEVLRFRMNAFIEAERARREEEARKAAEERAAAEAAARAAEAAEREAIENAEHGEFTDVGAATAQADEAFADFKKADRNAARADRAAANVKISGGFGRSLSQRSSEVLTIDDPVKALRAIIKERGGVLPQKIEDAMRAAARDFRKAKGRLPDGITSVKQRSL